MISRREFFYLAFAGILAACGKVIEPSPRPATGVPFFPTNTNAPTDTAAPTPMPTATPECPPIRRPYQTPKAGYENTRPADERNYSNIKYATIHHNEEIPAQDYCGLKVKAADLNWYHSTRDYDGDKLSDARYTGGEHGYSWVLYHYLVGIDGSVLTLQDPKYVLFHASDSCSGDESHNLHGIAICLDGNFDMTEPTKEQMYSAAYIIRRWQQEHGVKLEVRGHGERIAQSHCGVEPKTCPGERMGSSDDPNSLLGQIIAKANE